MPIFELRTKRSRVRIPPAVPKRKTRRKSCLSFWVPLPLVAPPFGDFNARAGKAAPAQFSAASSGSEFTAQKRRRPEGR